MTTSHSPRDEARRDSGRLRGALVLLARQAVALVAGLYLLQLAGCAAQLWPPTQWSVTVDLPWVHTPEPPPAPTVAPASSSAAVVASAITTPLKDPVNVADALDYAHALCALPPAELEAEIERLRRVPVQDGQAPLRAQQLAFAEQLARLYTEQQRLQEANERQAQTLRERQRRIEQLNGQIAAMRAVEYSLPQAAGGTVPHAAATKPAGAATPRGGATSFPVPSTPTVAKPLSPSAAEPSTRGEGAEAKLGDDGRTTPEP
ncbi:hypothetical protein ACLBKS_06525 [Hylemonella sp. W303a]|uniref:hypothetical protein n=1 Tax=Hylemonella sp. W303a TaxID=3389873 RepID=UPI00396B01D8